MAFSVATRFLGLSFAQSPPAPKVTEKVVKKGASVAAKETPSANINATKSVENGDPAGQAKLPVEPQAGPRVEEKVDEAEVKGVAKPDQIPKQTEAVEPVALEEVDAEESFRVTFFPPYIVDPEVLRDPFEPYSQILTNLQGGGHEFPVMKLQEFTLNDLELLGIIWNVSEPKAMFKDPESNIHIVGRDDRIGRKNGYIAVIREGEVVVVEPRRVGTELIYSTRIVRIKR